MKNEKKQTAKTLQGDEFYKHYTDKQIIKQICKRIIKEVDTYDPTCTHHLRYMVESISSFIFRYDTRK